MREGLAEGCAEDASFRARTADGGDYGAINRVVKKRGGRGEESMHIARSSSCFPAFLVAFRHAFLVTVHKCGRRAEEWPGNVGGGE